MSTDDDARNNAVEFGMISEQLKSVFDGLSCEDAFKMLANMAAYVLWDVNDEDQERALNALIARIKMIHDFNVAYRKTLKHSN
jgi:hypothetical protein